MGSLEAPRTVDNVHPDMEELERALVDQARAEARRDTFVRVAAPIVVVVAILVGWEITVRALDVAPYLVPAPSLVAKTFSEQWSVLLSNALRTLTAIGVGFVMAIVVGTSIALFTYFWKPFERGVYPLLVSLQAVPVVAIAPLLALWFGFSLTTRSLVAFILALFPVLIGTLVGLRSISRETILLAHSMGFSRTRTFVRIRLPQAMPNMFGGAKVALALSAVGAVVGEFIGGASGLGYLIQRANHDLNTALLFAALIVLAASSIILLFILEALERRLIPWHK